MTNGRGAAGMASFMTKKKKYKFQVDILLDELLEVPFVSAVLFAKLRLLDGGSFQDHSTREEVRDHKVKWGCKFSFPCKMMANASTGVMERCVLRISIRKESKGGRSFNKLGFVDLNLAEYAGAGVIHKKALLEGYDMRHRQDNSLLQFSITMNMLSGDILFKVPSPTLKHKTVIPVEEAAVPENHRSDDFSSGSLAGSVASGSSGFSSLPKKRPALLTSDLVIGQTLNESNSANSNAAASELATETNDLSLQSVDDAAALPAGPSGSNPGELPGHSRNSSNTSQLSKASGYGSMNSHSRQSSSGDSSGHIRGYHQRSVRLQQHPNPKLIPYQFTRTNTYPKRINIPNTILSESATSNELFSTPPSSFSPQISFNNDSVEFSTPKSSFIGSDDEYSNCGATQRNAFHKNVSKSTDYDSITRHYNPPPVLRSQSDFQIPKLNNKHVERTAFSWKSEFSKAFLSPRSSRRQIFRKLSPTNIFQSPLTPQTNCHKTNSLNSLATGGDRLTFTTARILTHRKLIEGNNTSNSGGGGGGVCCKLAPLINSPDDCNTASSLNNDLRRPSVQTNPSASSLVASETGSLDRAKAAYERRKKLQLEEKDQQQPQPVPQGRVEITRVNPDDLIEELIKNTNLEQADDSAETSGLQLFIAKDGTAALGNHEVKSQMSTGVQVFKQVVMDDR